jgi:diamine N-acetyltransferase
MMEESPRFAIALREVTGETVHTICGLSDTLLEYQTRMVAPNAVSIAQAHFDPKAWFRAIYADEEPVGFVMLYDDPETPAYYLWRFMIAGPHQGKGYGMRALELVLDYVRTRPNATEITLSYVPIDGNPEPFYRKLGFVPTGGIHDGEVVMKLALV